MNFRNRFKRYQPSGRRADIGLREIGRALLEFRIVLDDDLILVRRRIERCDLTRPELTIERIPHLIFGKAKRRRLVAIDIDGELRISDLQIRSYVAQNFEM